MKIVKRLLLTFALLLSLLALLVIVTYTSGLPTAKPMTWVYDYDLQPGNKAMAELLDKIHTERERNIQERRDGGPVRGIVRKIYQSVEGRLRDAGYLLLQGDWDATIEAADQILPKVEQGSAAHIGTLELLAISYLRKGEQENCINGHNEYSCLMPIKATGVYQLQDDTRRAIALYEQLLSLRPQDWRYRWLINVAYQTIGEYPEKVPEQWLIQSSLMNDINQQDNFINIGPSLGLSEISRAGGAVIEDLNNDGMLDLLLSDMYRGAIRFYLNDGNNGFIDNTDRAGLQGQIGVFNMVQLDYNNDGYLDILALRGAWRHEQGMHPNSLLRNNGDGTFTDVTVDSGILDYAPTSGAVCADFNRDGWIDFFVGNESGVNGGTEFPSEFYLNQGDGTFKKAATLSGLALSGLVKGLATGDYDNDGLTDLFVAQYRGENYLFKNTGNDSDGIPQFKNVAREAGVLTPLHSFTSWFWDYNNDGYLDLFVSELQYGKGKSAAEAARFYAGERTSENTTGFYRNNGDGTFTNILQQVGLDMPLHTMGANYADINNDGWLDFYIGTGEPDYMAVHPNRLLQNNQGNFFEDVTSEKGVGHIQKGHGIAFGDIDNDGDQDILAEMGGTSKGDPFQNALFQNPGNENSWVTLKLEGKSSSRDAIGTKVKLVISDAGEVREIYRSVSSGGSFGANSLQLESGLGKASIVDSLIINWPNSSLPQVFTKVEVNQAYQVSEGLMELKPLVQIPVAFHGLDHPADHQH